MTLPVLTMSLGGFSRKTQVERRTRKGTDGLEKPFTTLTGPGNKHTMLLVQKNR